MAASEDADTTPRARRAASRRHPVLIGGAPYAAGMVAGLAYYYLVPNPLLALPGLVVFAALAWLRLELALCLLPLTFPFWYVPKRALGQAVFPLSEIALGVCLAVAVGRLLQVGVTEIAKDAKKREGHEGETNAEIAEHRRVRREGTDLTHTSAFSESLSTFFAFFASLRALRVLRHPFWRWLALGAALLLIGTAAGVLIAVRPRDALRAFRWEVVEPLLYAGLVIACLLGRRTALSAGSPPGAADVSDGGGDDDDDDDGGRMSGQTLALAWLAGPVIAVGALFGVLAIAQVLWLHVTFTALAAGNQLVALPTVAGTSLVRATGIFYGSANSLGALLERVLPLALALLLWRALAPSASSASSAVSPLSTSASRPSRTFASFAFSVTPSSVEGLVLAACVLVMAVGLALTASRGAEVGAAVGLLLVLLAHPRTRRVAFGIVLLGVAVAIWQGSALLRAALAGHGASGEVRLLLWQAALHMIRDHPLLGIGPDQFLYYYDPAYTAHPYWIPRINGHLTPAAAQPDLAHPHNLILDLWLSGGVLGLVGFALVLGWLAWSCWRVWSASRRAAVGRWTARTTLVVGVAGGVLAGLAHGMVDSAYFEPDLALLFWWAAAVVALAGVERAAPRSRSRESPGATGKGT